MFNVGFANKKLIVCEFKHSDVGRKEAVSKITHLNSRNRTKNDIACISIMNYGTRTMRKELFARGDETTIGTPKIVNDWGGQCRCACGQKLENRTLEVVE